MHRSTLDITAILEDLANASVSVTATLVALSGVLPDGWAFQHNNNRVVASQFAADYGRTELERDHGESGETVLHGQRVRWWRVFPDASQPGLAVDRADAYDALELAFSQVNTELTKPSIDSRVAGFLGAERAKVILDPGLAFSYVLSRLGDDPLFEHEGFLRWLFWKVCDRMSRLAHILPTKPGDSR